MKSIIRILSIVILIHLMIVSCDEREKESVVPDFVDTAAKRAAFTEKDVNPVEDLPELTDSVKVMTSMGSFVIGLYGKDAPKTVENFLGLVRKRYYNGILIHRVAKDFIIQTGDNTTKYKARKADWGKGGQSFFGEPFADELNTDTRSYRSGYAYGTVAMANKGPNTNTSQFFICLSEAYELEKKWTIFGRVLSGMNVLEEINSIEVEPGVFEPNDGIPVKPIKIFSITIKK